MLLGADRWRIGEPALMKPVMTGQEEIEIIRREMTPSPAAPAAALSGSDGLLVMPDAIFWNNRATIIDLASKARQRKKSYAYPGGCYLGLFWAFPRRKAHPLDLPKWRPSARPGMLRKRAEQALYASEERWRRLFEASAAGIAL